MEFIKSKQRKQQRTNYHNMYVIGSRVQGNIHINILKPTNFRGIINNLLIHLSIQKKKFHRT